MILAVKANDPKATVVLAARQGKLRAGARLNMVEFAQDQMAHLTILVVVADLYVQVLQAVVFKILTHHNKHVQLVIGVKAKI